MSGITSAGSTRPSSLVRTHGPDRSPHSDFVSLIRRVFAGCYKPLLHFVRGDGSETVVRANGASGYTPFQVSGQRVFYYRYYAERRRVYSIPVPDAPDRCQAPVASPDGAQLAWLCNDGPPSTRRADPQARDSRETGDPLL